jgi:hypothetical protein
MSDSTKEIDLRKRLHNTAWVCVLNDDQIYTGLDGCWIMPTTKEQVKQLDEDGEPVARLDSPQFTLQKLLDWTIDAGFFDNLPEAKEIV